MAENENENLPTQLTDKELEEANGGTVMSVIDKMYGITDVFDSAGRVIGQYMYGSLTYCPCPNAGCGLPLHQGGLFTSGLFCDKCDARFSGPTSVVWTGTEEELIAFADKNI